MNTTSHCRKAAFALLLAAWLLPAAASDIATAARRQVGVTVHYDPAYRTIAFPNGDVPRDRGVCTDVVVRALREARQIDLQQQVHDDMAANWNTYPRNWNGSKPDPNIDHRRVPNLMTYFTRRGQALGVSTDPASYEAGDIVAWNLGGNVLHIGIVSDRSADGRPLIIHNIARGAQEEDLLLRYPIIGHYRVQ